MRHIAVAVFCILVAGCAKEAGKSALQRGGRGTPTDERHAKVSEVIAPAPRFVDHALLGTELGKDGMVAKEGQAFVPGQTIYLTIVLRESPPGLQTSAVWAGVDKKALRVERKEMNGAKVATFGFRDPNIKPGHYRVTAYWGGNVATERDFDIVAPEKAARKKG